MESCYGGKSIRYHRKRLVPIFLYTLSRKRTQPPSNFLFMKYVSLCFFATLFIINIAQAQNEPLLLDIDEPWRSERLDFPISFAPSLDYKGIEEVRFAKGWGNPESDEFWTYTFLWYLDEDPNLTIHKLEKDLETYFDGLMGLVGKGNGLTDIPDTKVVLAGLPDTNIKDFDGMRYQGKANVFDAFFSKKIQTLQVGVISDYCPKTKKYTVLFTFSPQERTHPIWKTLQGIQLSVDCE